MFSTTSSISRKKITFARFVLQNCSYKKGHRHRSYIMIYVVLYNEKAIWEILSFSRRTRKSAGFPLKKLKKKIYYTLLHLSVHKYLCTYLWCAFHRFLMYIGSCGNPDAKRLYDDLLSNYNKLVRPVVNVSDAVEVKLKLKLSQLIDVVSIYYQIQWAISKQP